MSDDACAKCGAPLPKLDRGPPRRLCAKCRTATLLGVAAADVIAEAIGNGSPAPPAEPRPQGAPRPGDRRPGDRRPRPPGAAPAPPPVRPPAPTPVMPDAATSPAHKLPASLAAGGAAKPASPATTTPGLGSRPAASASPKPASAAAGGSPAAVSSAESTEPEEPERSSVLEDLRSIAAAAPVEEPHVIDDELIPVAELQNGEPVAAEAAADAHPAARMADSASSLDRFTPTVRDQRHVAAPPAVTIAGNEETCPHCGQAMPAMPVHAAGVPEGALGRVRAVLGKHEVRTWAPWGIAGVSLLLAVIAFGRGGKHATADAAPAGSGDAEAAAADGSANADGTKPAPPPKVAAAGTKPKPAKSADAKEPLGDKKAFDRAAATSALNAAAGHAAGCKTPGGPTGLARVTATFAPNGKVSNAFVAPPFAGTASGECIAKAFRNASVAPFEGQPVPMSKTLTIR